MKSTNEGKKRESDETLSRLFEPVAEGAVIHAVVFDGRFERAAKVLEPEHFAGGQHRKFYRAATEVANTGTPVAIGSVYAHLVDTNQYADGDFRWLMDLHAEYPEIIDVETFANRVRRRALSRGVYQAVNQLMVEASAGTLDAQEAAARLTAVAPEPKTELRKIGDALSDSGGLDGLLRPPKHMIGTPWQRLSHHLAGGLRGGELVIVAARPGMGKTTLALQLAAHVARHAPVLFFSLEMKRREMLTRLISAYSGVPLRDLIACTLTADERAKVSQASSALEDMTLEIRDDVARVTELIQTVKRTSPRLVVVDYIGLLLTGQRAENRNAEITAISRALKLCAMSEDVPIIALSQLSRDPERRTDHRPVLSDLRDSGSLEQDADVVLFIYRPVYYKREAEHLKEDAEVILAKQRNGLTGVAIPLRFSASTCQFREPCEAEGKDATS